MVHNNIKAKPRREKKLSESPHIGTVDLKNSRFISLAYIESKGSVHYFRILPPDDPNKKIYLCAHLICYTHRSHRCMPRFLNLLIDFDKKHVWHIHKPHQDRNKGEGVVMVTMVQNDRDIPQQGAIDNWVEETIKRTNVYVDK